MSRFKTEGIDHLIVLPQPERVSDPGISLMKKNDVYSVVEEMISDDILVVSVLLHDEHWIRNTSLGGGTGWYEHVRVFAINLSEKKLLKELSYGRVNVRHAFDGKLDIRRDSSYLLKVDKEKETITFGINSGYCSTVHFKDLKE
ncbi:MAG: hypothetical protein R3Y43_05075 [Alphaproteobacteria bacterium]